MSHRFINTDKPDFFKTFSESKSIRRNLHSEIKRWQFFSGWQQAFNERHYGAFSFLAFHSNLGKIMACRTKR